MTALSRYLMLPLLALTTAGAVSAQTIDLSGEAGWFNGSHPRIDGAWDDRHDAGTGGVAAGIHVTDRIKLELRGAFSGEATIYEQQPRPLPGQPFPTYELFQHKVSTATAGGGVHYQFFDNAWFHPHVGAGLELQHHRDRVNGETRVDWELRPYVATGFKWYVTERGFVRSDLRLTTGNVAWTAGVGVDLRAPSRAVPPDVDLWRSFAQNVEPGARLRVRTRDGHAFAATLLEARATGVVVQPAGRRAEPARVIPYGEILSLEREKPGGGMSAGKAAAIGVAAGAGGFAGVLAILMAALGD